MSEKEREADSIPQFCEAYGISRAFFYKLRKAGKGPRVVKIGNRSMILKDDGRDWRRKLQEQAA